MANDMRDVIFNELNRMIASGEMNQLVRNEVDSWLQEAGYPVKASLEE